MEHNQSAFFSGQDGRESQETRLLMAVIDDDRDTVKEILDKNPDLLIKIPPENLVIESQYTWQQFYAESPFIMALKRNQVEMIKVMMPTIKKLDGENKETLLQQWENAEKEMEMSKENVNAFDFGPLVDAIINGEVTEDALEKFRQTVHPNKAIALNEYFDIEQLLIKAYDTYNNDYYRLESLEWNYRDIFCVKIIGFIQGLLSPEDGKVFCEGLHNVVKMNQQIRDLAKSLVLLTKDFFYSSDRNCRSGLGFEYFVVAGESDSLEMRAVDSFWRFTLLESYVQQKTAELGEFKKQLSQQHQPPVALGRGVTH